MVLLWFADLFNSGEIVLFYILVVFSCDWVINWFMICCLWFCLVDFGFGLRVWFVWMWWFVFSLFDDCLVLVFNWLYFVTLDVCWLNAACLLIYFTVVCFANLGGWLFWFVCLCWVFLFCFVLVIGKLWFVLICFIVLVRFVSWNCLFVSFWAGLRWVGEFGFSVMFIVWIVCFG